MTEHEFKFALSDSMLAEFTAGPDGTPAAQPRRLLNRYFDTAAGDLMNAGVSLRIRRTPDGAEQTVKAAGSGPFERYEWEQPVAGDEPDGQALPPPGEPTGDLVRDALGLLAPVFETDFERRTRRVATAGGLEVELACDQGVIRAGNRSEGIAEVELEHKAGSIVEFYQFVRHWASQHNARLLLPSKNERGLQLAGWLSERSEAVKVVPEAPAGDEPAATAARRILTGHLHHVLANLAPVLTSVSIEGPHQLRVGLRRLRAAIRFLDLKSGGDEHERTAAAPSAAALETARRWTVIDTAARSLADAAGLVRDVDVLERGLLAELDQGFPGDASLQLTRRMLRLSREQDRQRLRHSIGDAGTTDFVLRTLIAIESLDTVAWPAGRFDQVASARVMTLARKVRRRARAARSEDDWHEVRIAIKNLRYALESCSRLEIDGESMADLAGPLGRWQEALGLGQDLAVARAVASRALSNGQASTEMSVRAAALIDGYRVYATRAGDPEKLRKPIVNAMERLIRAVRSDTRRARADYHEVLEEALDEFPSDTRNPAPAAESPKDPTT